MKKNICKIIIITILLAFAIFNLKYIIEAKFEIECFGASMFLTKISNERQAIINLLLFLIFIFGTTIPYLILIAKDKEENKEKKQDDKKEVKKWFIFILIVSILCGIILPNNSSDVYYYIASGRADSIYGDNMYDVNFVKIQEDLKDDKVISASPSWDQTFVYGVVFAGICKLVGSIPVENMLCLLSAFKILNIIAHILNCYLIYKITKNKRLMLIYGLNPLVLFEGIINCHNDIYMVLFILLALYFKKENKIDLAIISIALGALIKYIPIIILPYIIWEKGNLKKMILLRIRIFSNILWNKLYILRRYKKNSISISTNGKICKLSLFSINSIKSKT